MGETQVMSDRPTVVVTRRLPPAVERTLEERFDARLNPEDRPLSPKELSQALVTADGVLCTVTDRIDAAVLAATPLRARILANFGVGYNHIDIAEAERRGLVVSNTPGVLTESTADLTMALILMVARRLGEGERELRRGAWTGWRPTHLMAADVAGRTLGVVGLGRIGRAVARRASNGFGMRVLCSTPRMIPEAEANALNVTRVDSLEDLLAESDFVSLHCPALPETRHLINADRLARMKPTGFLINTARGDIVDQAALAQALEAGQLAGAGLDVYEDEPQVPQALLGREDVVLLPHLGSATASTRQAMGMKAVDNLELFFRTGEAPDAVTSRKTPPNPPPAR
jgi:lactate dehydrogenase-like 2-hydroxyacid dehydrogenase